VTQPSKPAPGKELPPVLRSLRGLLKDDGRDYREEHRKHLAARYR